MTEGDEGGLVTGGSRPSRHEGMGLCRAGGSLTNEGGAIFLGGGDVGGLNGGFGTYAGA